MGQCLECTEEKPKPLISKLCQYHYKKSRNKASEERQKVRAEKSGIDLTEEKQRLEDWFLFHMKYSARICENCGKDLKSLTDKEWRGSQHHVLEKSVFKSIATERFNHIVLGFYCCHPVVSSLPSKITEMSVFKKAKKIVNDLRPKIFFQEIRRIPEYFND